MATPASGLMEASPKALSPEDGRAATEIAVSVASRSAVVYKRMLFDIRFACGSLTA